MLLSAGDKLGPYEILAPIGKGGMGEVFRAHDSRLNRDVALKVSNAQFTERFTREAHAIAALNHTNICHLYDVGPDYLVMEYVEGQNLKGPLSLDEALPIVQQLIDGIEAAHEKNIVHRDLKPANIKVTPEGVVKILDFGLAKATEPSRANDGEKENSPTLTLAETAVGTILGTAAYMAPEQAKGKTADKRSDIWSFGVILYELLTGKRLFQGESAVEILGAVLNQEPDLSAAPRKVQRLLRWCLEKDRRKRLQAIGDARIGIEEAQAGAALSENGTSRRNIVPWAIAGLMTAFAAVASWTAWRAPRQPERPLMRLDVELPPDTSLATFYGRLALSPDGTLLAVSLRGADGQTRLGMRRIDQSQITLLDGTEGAIFPFFSPDGQWIAFSGRGQLKKVSVHGGVPVSLGGIRSMGGSWGDDGTIVSVLGVASGLSRIPSGGGVFTPVTQVDRAKGELAHRWPQVLPGSQTALFTVYDNSGTYDDSDIDIVSLKSGLRKTVYHGGSFARYLPSGHLVFIHQNTLFAAPFDLKRQVLTGPPQPIVDDIRNEFDAGADFDVSQTGILAYLGGKRESSRSIFWLDSAGHTQPLQAAPGLYSYPRISPDGKRLAFELDDGQGHVDIWVRDLERDTTSRLTSLPGRNQWPVWTPDSRNIVFLSLNAASPGIYWIRADGSGEAYRITSDNVRHIPQAITPDGKRLATLEAGPGTGVSIWTAPIEGDPNHPQLGKREPFLESPFINILPAFSPDGHWIAYTSGEPGRTGLWVRPFPGPGGQWQIDGAGRFPLWSRTGHQLFFLVDGRVMVADYTTKGDSFAAGKPRTWLDKRLLDLGSPPAFTHDLAPDGKRIAAVLYPNGTADDKPITHVTFLLNFIDELRRRVPVR
jgi:Tol biopolymer transport system component/predicted Ser/Thr protein kinase